MVNIVKTNASQIFNNLVEKRNMKKSDIAHKIGMTPQAFNNRISHNTLDADLVLKISKALNIDPAIFLVSDYTYRLNAKGKVNTFMQASMINKKMIEIVPNPNKTKVYQVANTIAEGVIVIIGESFSQSLLKVGLNINPQKTRELGLAIAKSWLEYNDNFFGHISEDHVTPFDEDALHWIAQVIPEFSISQINQAAKIFSKKLEANDLNKILNHLLIQKRFDILYPYIECQQDLWPTFKLENQYWWDQKYETVTKANWIKLWAEIGITSSEKFYPLTLVIEAGKRALRMNDVNYEDRDSYFSLDLKN